MLLIPNLTTVSIWYGSTAAQRDEELHVRSGVSDIHQLEKTELTVARMNMRNRGANKQKKKKRNYAVMAPNQQRITLNNVFL